MQLLSPVQFQLIKKLKPIKVKELNASENKTLMEYIYICSFLW